MDWLAPVLGVGGDLLGTGISGHYNAREAAKNREWQEYMSNTAYRRAAVDLEKAGLNRVLALGSPASTPSGASASISPPPLGKTGIAAASAKQAIDQSKAQEALFADQSKQSQAQAGLIDEQKRLTKIQADTEEVKKVFFQAFQPYIDDIVKTFQPGAGNSGNPLKSFVSGAKDAITIEDPKAAIPPGLTAEGQKGKTPEQVRKEAREHMKGMSGMEQLKFFWNLLMEHF